MDKVIEKILNELKREVKNNNKMLIAIDGLGGSGKSSFAEVIRREIPLFDVVKMDDFYIPSMERGSKGYHNFDIEKLIEEVISPFINNEDVKYSKYNWIEDRLEGEYTVSENYLIIEGVYSTSDRLKKYYDKKMWIDCHRDIRLHRGLVRDGEKAYKQWVDEWMPLEDRYVESQKPQENADYILNTNPF